MMKAYSLKVGGQSFTARIVEYTETKVVVDLNGSNYEVELSSETLEAEPPRPAPAGGPKKRPVPPSSTSTETPSSRPSSLTAAIGPQGVGAVTAPIPGAVKQILVAVGDYVSEGAVVLVLEAMKMENEISARGAGKVSEIAVGLGESVQEGQLLLQIEVS